MIFIRLSPDGFALGFDSFACGEDDDSAVEDAQGAFDFGGEVNVTGRVDQIKSMFLPIEGNAGGLDGDSSFLFFGIAKYFDTVVTVVPWSTIPTLCTKLE